MDSIWGMGVDDVLDWSTRRSEGGGFHALEHNLIGVAVTLLVITGASMIRCPEPNGMSPTRSPGTTSEHAINMGPNVLLPRAGVNGHIASN